MIHTIIPLPGKIRPRVDAHDEILKDLIIKYLKSNGIKARHGHAPRCWVDRYTVNVQINRKTTSEAYNKLCKIYSNAYGAIVSHKVITTFGKSEFLETYIVMHSKDGVELAAFDKLYSECYTDFINWCNTTKSNILSEANDWHIQKLIELINEFMDRITRITESDGKTMDIPLKLPSEYKNIYWRFICLINIIDFMGYVENQLKLS